jgi:uncharacterized protein YgiM (DUF1202 family)
MKSGKLIALAIWGLGILFLQACLLEDMVAVKPVPVFTATFSVSTQEINVTYSTESNVNQRSRTVNCEVKTGLETGNLNLRSCGSMSCTVITVLNEGDKLDFLGKEKDGWKEVQLDRFVGWVNSSYVGCN